MISEERLLNLLLSPHISEKTSINMQKNNTVILKVLKDATKFEIKIAIEKLFQVYVKKVNILVIKGKKRKKNKIVKSNNWKKAYIILKSGQNLNFLNNKNS
ncbi:50S ribosomal protein L23 [Buchnera aphidicola (Cinara tujafilina)]|uniref:Large ribosomal subunit protein uL23 n=1 Tax=Buchnera aphidicola (Cinara tujafilina) TaxID=261317 RepID=F7WZP4_9GAMM|nr:50S ribosomal protein L23 [Buchnera aphidicola]AEH39915.1 50S ribosomal protein L23 [Buchnera aphidicola (Cinara tujafilina)]